MEIHSLHGFLGLWGARVDCMAEQAVEHLRLHHCALARLASARPPYHITLLTKAELRELPADHPLVHHQPDTTHIYPLGVGSNAKAGVVFLVVIWAHGQQLRKRFSLPPKQFHITLSAHDAHDINKGIESLLPGELPDAMDVPLLDHLVVTLQMDGHYDRAESFALQLCQYNPESEKGFLRLADCAFKLSKYKLAMLAYACAFARDERRRTHDYCKKRITACAQYTEWGPVLTERETVELPAELSLLLVAPWPLDLRADLSEQEIAPVLSLPSRESLFIPSATPSSPSPAYMKLPRFFRWLIPFRIALMSTPRNAHDITMLGLPHIGIRHVLTLTEEEPLSLAWFHGTRIKHTFLPIPNYRPPTIEQMDLLLHLLNDEGNTPMLIHCGGGKGRAGTVAACYLTAYGFRKPKPDQTFPALSAHEAISALRAIRPGSIETPQQETFVSRYCSAIWKRHCVLPNLEPEPPASELEMFEGTFDNPDFVVLVGLPGSGKSWICGALLARDASHWTRVSQDETGSRATCETEVGRGPPRGTRMLLDRCNTSSSDRAAWLALADHWAQRPVAVWLDYPPKLCISRAQNRAGHPTLPPGGRVRAAVEQAGRMLVPPSCTEGFTGVVRVRSFEAAKALVLRLSPLVGLLKFPRTPHLLNLGAVSADDLVNTVSPALLRHGQRVVITEKVDGANMGFSLDVDGMRVLTQNRSHYVQPDTHAQFRQLRTWVERHSLALIALLGRDKRFPERFILYGEWLTATHSIPYENLPDVFLAFDLYDRATGSFTDRASLEALLDGTGILTVPVVEVRENMPSAEHLRKMVHEPSAFYNGKLEGVCVKIEEDGRVLQRGKVVRGDFIAGNEHWTKAQLRLNGFICVDGA